MFDFITATRALLRNESTPWVLAPDPIKQALASVEKAQTEHAEATAATQDAAIEAPAAKARWDAAAKQAVKDDKPLPSRDKPDRAKFVLELAEERLRVAEQGMTTAVGSVASALEMDQELRQEWIDAMDARADTLRAEIRAAADAVAPAVAELNGLLGAGLFVAQWKTLPYVPAPIEGDPVGALHAAANARGHADLTGNITA